MILELASVTAGAVGLFFAHRAYTRRYGYLKLHVDIKLGEDHGPYLETGITKAVEKTISLGVGHILDDMIYVNLVIRKIGHQAVTVDKIYLCELAFFEGYREVILGNFSGDRLGAISNQINDLLGGATFKDLNSKVLAQYERTITEDCIFDSKGALNVQVNHSPLRVGPRDGCEFSLTEQISAAKYCHEGNMLSFFLVNVLCLDSQGRMWQIDRNSHALLAKYSISRHFHTMQFFSG